MGLTYDSSAIRYATTQKAYGCTWTLNKIENDGAQVWRNAKGQEAIVHKACEQVKQSHREYQVNLSDRNYGLDRLNKRIANNYSARLDTMPRPDPVWKLTNFGQGDNAFEKVVGDKRLASDGKTILRWDGHSWKIAMGVDNSCPLSADEESVLSK